MRHRSNAIVRNAGLLVLAGLVSPQFCPAQVDPWERVKLLQEGKQVSVTLHSRKQIEGKMQHWSPEAITLLQGHQLLSLEKAQISKVEFVTGMSRGTKAGIAGGITGGVFLGLGGLVCARSHCSAQDVGAVMISTGIFSLGAAGIAAAFGPHKELIYANMLPPPLSSIEGSRLLYNAEDPVKSGDKIKIKFQLTSKDGGDLSSPVLALTAVGVSWATDPAAPITPLSPHTNPDLDFHYDPKLGGDGGYVFTLNTRGLPPGAYNLNYRAAGDEQTLSLPFRVK
jgi:hypothetical protein